MVTEMVTANKLSIADIVQVFDDAFGTAIVKQVTEKEISFFRPYAVNADFSYTGGVLCYTGTEEWSVPNNDHTRYRRIRKSLPLK
jgi:hypothetical protein